MLTLASPSTSLLSIKQRGDSAISSTHFVNLSPYHNHYKRWIAADFAFGTVAASTSNLGEIRDQLEKHCRTSSLNQLNMPLVM